MSGPRGRYQPASQDWQLPLRGARDSEYGDLWKRESQVGLEREVHPRFCIPLHVEKVDRLVMATWTSYSSGLHVACEGVARRSASVARRRREVVVVGGGCMLLGDWIFPGSFNTQIPRGLYAPRGEPPGAVVGAGGLCLSDILTSSVENSDCTPPPWYQ